MRPGSIGRPAEQQNTCTASHHDPPDGVRGLGKVRPVGMARAHDGARNGNAKSCPHLSTGGGDRRGDSCLRPRHALYSAIGDRGVDHAESNSKQHVDQQQQSQGRSAAQAREHPCAEQKTCASDQQGGPCTLATHQTPGKGCANHHHHGKRQGTKTGMEGGQSADLLQVQGVEKQKPGE